ncbi:probable peptidyl-tRNA hydrolase 2 [Homarus americanus]|uniref:peptidyl-tRNA hydrolase n=1 Tax=Homarus americanus TaxID=6706 RepID=A0A8J5MNB5_HOMAM|nr:probable peptidyl-tRNA hydrolase 2 [Homarus americanus]XP_042242750.1 probable peptidyl-tRNA hydrolase 2 [Homarus americanus]XP_042242751.1 probable peptidyl-tRNA hydrolase 2 [Homarus americanus]XP_042242752.1 probable peptidyl-tRNA hydrolase 2 [Homarus americanus]XP_042242753.1 probable peptidyl-tRNA hydrolase 2 [Homarus americanus]XP_042242754.1 probable peptidyl-tRNA hydrolase 2 [Homarus americanus]XP_042242755.1 probable peptidyl-tRNA hydrolase 2 [Homarus americanus]KAG7157565.1 pepti
MEQEEEKMMDSSQIKLENQEDSKADGVSQEQKKGRIVASDANTKVSVDQGLYESLVSMGMDKRLAAKALVCTGNKNVDAALSWIAELGADEMEALCGNSDHGSNESDEWEDCEEDDDDDEDTYYKMVFVVNTDLSMGAGKVAAQVGHAALGLYRLLREDEEKYEASVEEWEEFGERKIALKGKNSQELIELQKKAEALYLPTYLVQDAGKTQVPAGSTTVLAIFGDEEAVNEVTGKLKLL